MESTNYNYSSATIRGLGADSLESDGASEDDVDGYSPDFFCVY